LGPICVIKYLCKNFDRKCRGLYAKGAYMRRGFSRLSESSESPETCGDFVEHPGIPMGSWDP